MDTVIPDGGDRRGDPLLDKVEAAQQALQRAASAAFLKGDPMAEQMQALARSLGAQYDIFCAAKTMQTNLEQSVRSHTDTVTNGTATPVVHTVELLDWATGGPAPQSMRLIGSRLQQ